MNSKRVISPTLFRLVLVSVVLIFVALLIGMGALQVEAASPLTLVVVSARTEDQWPPFPCGTDYPEGCGVANGDPVTEYKYIINVDNTGDPGTGDPTTDGCSVDSPGYPDSCDWPSVREVPGAAPIYTQGNQNDFAGGGIDLPDGKYLISVLADGFKMGGAHFTVPFTDTLNTTVVGDGGEVTVALQPHPLPAATLRIRVFEDISPINGAFDAPSEFPLAGFFGIVKDPAGDVTTDVFGNPLCTEYDADGNSLGVPTWDDPLTDEVEEYTCVYSGIRTADNPDGDIIIPNLGPNRYDVEVAPPAGEGWIRTTTLEGSWSWDSWLAEGGDGLDNEFVVAGEPFPWTQFGYVNTCSFGDINDRCPANDAIPPADSTDPLPHTGGVKGTIVSASIYLPQQNGLPYQGGVWGGLNGTKVNGPINDAWVALSDLQNGDTAIYVGKVNDGSDDPDLAGTFEINGVPDGNYLFTWWDNPLHHILDWTQITVADGQIYDMGAQMLTGWFTKIDGYVFNDLNKNGRKDPQEKGIANYLVGLRDRDNSEIDRMSVAVTTDRNGYYVFERAYPMGSWMVLEAYNDRFYTTGITYQVENQPKPTTIMGDGVDVGVLPILGQSGRLDWGVHAYEEGTNGGIVGSVFYETTRNEFDQQYEAIEPWSPGIPGLTMNLYATVPCPAGGSVPCDPTGSVRINPDGSAMKGELLNTTVTEVWEQPRNCTARDANGNPLTSVSDPVFGPAGVQDVLPPYTGDFRCLEGPLMGTQFQSGFAALDGNWGFTEGCFGPGGAISEGVCDDDTDPIRLPAGDYLVEVDPGLDARGLQRYKVGREEDVNVFGGDQYVPAVPPPACAGALHIVDVAGDPSGIDGYGAIVGDGTNGVPVGVTVPPSTPVVNPSFADPEAGGSPFEGTPMPYCNIKLVTLNNGKSIAPTFTLHTDVPIPGKWKGYIISDLALSTDKKSLTFGEKAGLADSPIGIYDYSNRLITTITSDYNGTFEVLLPSTHTVNCPSPSGMCASMYYMLGNDPGQPGQLNANYDPQYRTIGATFEIWPGLIMPSDLAPTQMVNGVIDPATTQSAAPDCSVDFGSPQLFAVSKPYVVLNENDLGRTFTIEGLNFGGTTGTVSLGGTPLTIVSWSDTTIEAMVASTMTSGPYQLDITTSGGKSPVNSLTFHALGGNYNPKRYEVGIPGGYTTIQEAIDTAASEQNKNNPKPTLVVVYPGTPELWNPEGAYYENLVLYAPVKLQGVGPGGVYPDGTQVLGSVIDGRGVAGDTAYADTWRIFVGGLNWDGNQNIFEGAVIYILGEIDEFNEVGKLSIDGLKITGGDQQGFPNAPAAIPGLKEAIAVQGGGIFANAYARYLQITNNVLQSNGGSYAGAIRLGTPHLPDDPATAINENDNQNDFVRIAHNRILANGGTNLAGAIGLFSGSDGYEVAHNDICGNFSAEYGGGISHYGYSPGGSIHHNRLTFNRAYDEGGGIIIAGELPADPTLLSTGAGPVDVYANLIQANLGNDDGGGLRFLMAGNFTYNVYNNFIANNISTHEGGGVSLNDAPDVRFYNNTVMKNLTTATAVTSNGFPAPAGLSTSANSALLQAHLVSIGSPFAADSFSNPLMFNNIFWDNRAGTWTGGGIAGIGQLGPADITHWDLGVLPMGSGVLSPTNSLLQTTLGAGDDGTNLVGVDPLVVEEFDVNVQVLPWRGNANFVDPLLVALETRVDLLGDYHLQGGSPAINLGAPSKDGISAPTEDIDGDGRPADTDYDAGADEGGDGPPVVAIVSPADGSPVSGDVTIQVEATDDIDAIGTLTVEVSITGTWQTAIYSPTSGYYEWVWTTDPHDNDDNRTIDARATDSSNNTGNAQQVSVIVDNIDDPPAVEITSPVTGSVVYEGAGITVLVLATDDIDAAGTLTVEVSVDGGAMWQPAPYNGAFYELLWSPVTAGIHTIDARATDSWGNVTYATQVSITVEPTPVGCMSNCLRVQSISLSYVPQGNSGKFKVFAGVTVVDENGTLMGNAVVDVTWLWPDGISTDLQSETTDGIGSVTFNTKDGPGTYVITVDNITLTGFTFDPVNSVQTSDITVP